jgi:alpha-galactosidase
LPEPGKDYDPGTLSLVMGIGAHFQTYYKELTEAQLTDWTKWLTLYNDLELYKAEYLNLYDIAFDVPEIHTLRREDVTYYYVPDGFKGEIELRGLGQGKYKIVDYINNRELAIVDGINATLLVDSDDDIHFYAKPVPE